MPRNVRDNNNYQNNHPNKLNNNPTNQYNKSEYKHKICNETQNFYLENPHTNCGDNKSRGLRLLV